MQQQPDNNSLDTDTKYMRMAINEAQKALEKGEVPIGALVVCRDRILGRGHNMIETLGDATAHAEMQALTAAAGSLGGKYLPECTLYVTVEPCPMCAAASSWCHVGRIVWGADDPKRGYTRFAPSLLHPKTKTSRGVLADECEGLMTRFFENLRR